MANPELFVLLLNAVVTGFAYFYIYPYPVVPTATKSQSMILCRQHTCSLRALFFWAAALHSILLFSPQIGS